MFLMVFGKVVFFLPICLLDGLLEELSNSGVGYYWSSSFVGALAYADDIVLLAPCASALRCSYAKHLQQFCN